MLSGSTVTENDRSLRSRQAVAVLRTFTGSGSGFLLEDGGVPWLITNAHVIRGGRLTYARTLNGKALKLGAMQVATHRDLARFAVRNVPAGIAFTLADDLHVGERIYAYGNSHGRGTVPELPGTVVSEGPAQIEISCEIVAGNSGGPVVNDAGQIVGVSTYAIQHEVPDGKFDWAAGTRFVKIRRFATRLDQGPEWISVDSKTYYAQLAYLADVDLLIRELCPALIHYHSLSHTPLFYQAAEGSAGYRIPGLRQSIKRFYIEYAQFISALKIVQEAYDAMTGRVRSSAQFVRAEEQRLRLARQRRESKSLAFHKTAIEFCRQPLAVVQRTQWCTPYLEKNAAQAERYLLFVDQELTRLASDVLQRKKWE